MEVYKLVILLTSVFLSIVCTEITNGCVERELFEHKSKVQICISTACLTENASCTLKLKENSFSNILLTRVRVEKVYYSQVERLLNEYMNGKVERGLQD